MLRVAVLLSASALALGACGGGERAARVEPVAPSATSADAQGTSGQAGPAPAAPAGPTGATGPASGATGAPAAPTTPPASPADANPGGASADSAGTGGAGDEEPIRQAARFQLGSVTLEPASVRVAPFLGVRLVVVNVDEGVHHVELVGTDTAFDVQGGQTARRTLPGLEAGMYTLSVDGGKQAASVVAGDEAAG